MQRNQAMVVDYNSPLFSEIKLANRFKNTLPSGAKPAPVVHTNGVKLPCSTSCTRCPYGLLPLFLLPVKCQERLGLV